MELNDLSSILAGLQQDASSKIGKLRQVNPIDTTVPPDDSQRQLASAMPMPAPTDDVPPAPMAAPAPDQATLLQQSMAAQNQNQLLAGVSRGADIAGAGLAAARPNTEGADALAANAGAPVSNLLTQQKFDKGQLEQEAGKAELRAAQDITDPTSDESKLSRQILAKLGYKVPDTANAAQLDKLFPKLVDLRKVQDNQDTKRMLASDKSSAQDEREASKLAVTMQKDLDPSKASSRSPLGKAALKVQSSQAIDALGSSYKNLNSLDTRQIQEIARSLDNLLSQGGATVTGTEHLVPKTALANGSKLLEWISSNPQGAQQGAFVARMMDTVKRERALAEKQIYDYQKAKLASYSRLKKLDPDTYGNVVSSFGLDQDFKDANPAAAQVTEAPHQGKYPPGQVIKYQGKMYRVAADGDNLEPL